MSFDNVVNDNYIESLIDKRFIKNRYSRIISYNISKRKWDYNTVFFSIDLYN